jgi:diguanylate cyclase (GGDEF)-like protein
LGAIIKLAEEPDGPNLPAAVEAADNVKSLIDIDSKTGLYKQEAFFNHLGTTIAELSHQESVTLFVFDAKAFKTINDTLGHQAGDRLLAIFGKALSSSFVRASDIVAHGSRDNPDDRAIARFGGDEFAAYYVSKEESYPDEKRTSNIDANQRALLQIEHINNNISEAIIGTEFEGLPVSLSAGFTVLEGADLEQADQDPAAIAESIFVIADYNMFKSKYSDRLANITDDDRERLQAIIPYIESLGSRVEPWLKQAAGLEAA